MKPKYFLSKAVTAIGSLVVAVGIIAAYAGFAEPFVSPSELPGSVPAGIAAAIAVFGVGGILWGVIDRRRWTTMGRELGTRPRAAASSPGQTSPTRYTAGRFAPEPSLER